MSTPPNRLEDRLADVVGADHVLTDPDLVRSHETDWTRRYRGKARCVVRPRRTSEVEAVLALCAGEGTPVVPQGGNTGLVGGGVPRDHEVVLSMRRCRDMDPVDGDGGTIVAAAGTRLVDVQHAAHEAGYDFAIDMAARDTATIGGMIATNAGGVHVLRYGAMAEQLVGIEAVLADGTVIGKLPGLRKDNTGYHLPSLLAGSEGTLAVITRAHLRLVPLLPERAVALLGLATIEDTLAVVGHLRRNAPTLHALEIVTAAALALVQAHTGAARPLAREFPFYLLVELAATDGQVDVLADVLTGVIDMDEAAVADSKSGRDALWAYRENISEAINAAGIPHKLDVSLPPTRIAEFTHRVDRAVRTVAGNAETIIHGHAADGNLHVNVLGPDPDDFTVDTAVLRLVADCGGSISAEHGIGIAKAPFLSLTRSRADIETMRAIRQALDPSGILNPGVIFD